MSLIEAYGSRDEWLQARTTGIGASDAAALFGVSRYHSPVSLYYEKRGMVPMGEAEREAIYWGRILQSPIATRYADETKRDVEEPGPFELRRHPTAKFMIASLDAIATPVLAKGARPGPEGALSPGNVEIKNVGFFKLDDWADEPPLLFQIQAQHQMFVEGLQWGSIAALVGGNQFFYADLKRNDRFIEVLVKVCQRFWDAVLKGEPPEADATEPTRNLLRALYPLDTGEVKALQNPAWVDVDGELLRLKEAEKKLEARRDELEARLKLEIGSASVVTLPNGAIYTYRTVPAARVEAYDRKAYRTLRRQKEKK